MFTTCDTDCALHLTVPLSSLWVSVTAHFLNSFLPSLPSPPFSSLPFPSFPSFPISMLKQVSREVRHLSKEPQKLAGSARHQDGPDVTQAQELCLGGPEPPAGSYLFLQAIGSARWYRASHTQDSTSGHQPCVPDSRQTLSSDLRQGHSSPSLRASAQPGGPSPGSSYPLLRPEF